MPTSPWAVAGARCQGRLDHGHVITAYVGHFSKLLSGNLSSYVRYVQLLICFGMMTIAWRRTGDGAVEGRLSKWSIRWLNHPYLFDPTRSRLSWTSTCFPIHVPKCTANLVKSDSTTDIHTFMFHNCGVVSLIFLVGYMLSQVPTPPAKKSNIT